jgi:two-component system response regulator RpaA
VTMSRAVSGLAAPSILQEEEMARILLVPEFEDRDVVGLVALGLKRQGHEVKVAGGGPSALDIAVSWKPDLIVVCGRHIRTMDGIMDGFELCQRLRALPQTCQCPILLLSASTRLEERVAALKTGIVDDCLTKPFDLAELEWRVRALLRRSQPSAPEYLQVGPLILNRQSYEVEVEFDLLSHLMQHPGQVFSNDQLLQAVWGCPPGVGSPALVRVHIRNLRHKVERDPGNPALLQTVRGHGYTVRD